MRIAKLAALIAALTLLPAASALAANTAVITDPYTNASSQHATAVEPDTFAAGGTLVATAQIGRFFDGGSSGTGFATLTNNGTTLAASGPLPGLTDQAPFAGGPFDRTTDPVVAYSARDNVWMISSLGLEDPGPDGAAVVVNRSADGGLSWGNPDTVAVAPEGADYDKNWVVCDNHAASPFYGRCYHTWDDFGDGDRILMSTSTDAGAHWSAPIMTDKRVYGLGGQPVVQPDGTVIVPAANAFETSVIAFRSTNGGASWGDEVIVAHVRDHGTPGNLRAGPLPTAEIGSDGRVYTVWQDCRFSKGCKTNALVISSSDDGVNWSEVRRVPINDGSDQFIPGIAVTGTGSTTRLGLTYYFYADPACGGKDTPACQLRVGYVQSNDGGGHWSNSQTLAGPFPVAWTPDTSQGRMVGDYISTSWIGNRAFGAFAVAKQPSGTVFDQKIYIPQGGARATSFPNAMVAEKSFSDNSARHANTRSVIRPARKEE